MRHSIGAIVLAVGLMGMPPSARAHHSLEDTHDLRRSITLAGVVSGVEWVNPHARLLLEVPSAGGQRARWSIELGAPNTMTRLGLDRAALKSGDQVSVDVWIAKDTSLTASAYVLKLSDGRTFQMPTLWARRSSR
jgi:hypothetical protein